MTVPMPEIVGRCKVCGVTVTDVETVSIIISPSGVAHISNGWESTCCGHDATGDDWWWPL